MTPQESHDTKWPQDKRDAYLKEHPENFAGPGTSFPIADAEDVQHAAHLWGQANHPPEVKTKIKSIANDLGLKHALPASWAEEEDDPEDEDDQDDQEGDEYNKYGNLPDLPGGPNDLQGETMDTSGQVIKESTLLTIEGQILEGQQPDKKGHEVRVTVIKGGQSKNGFSYDQATLQQMARMLEGAQAYADHDVSVPVRSVKDLVGFYKNATYMAPDSSNPYGRVDATLHIMESAEWLWSIIYESVSMGKPNLIGLSVDIFGKWQQDGNAKHVTGIQQINSCDIVTRPSAGGEFQRILQHQQRQQSSTNPKKQGAPMPDNKPTETTETSAPPVTQPPAPPQDSRVTEQEQHLTTASQILEQQQLLKKQQEETSRLLEQAKLERAAVTLDQRLMGSILPEAVKAMIRTRFANRIFEAEELENELLSQLNLMAALTNSGVITGHGYSKPQIGEQITEAEKVQAAFDLMFEDSHTQILTDAERTKFAGIKPFASLRDAYVRATGDSIISGASSNPLGTIRVSEHAPMGRITEADTTTASFSFLLGTSMNKRLLKDYQAWPAEWQRLVTVVPIKDFKQQTRVRLGAFGSLSTVAEDTSYTTISLTDTAATYVPTKRGNLVTVSRETIINDDLMAVKQIPTKLAVAAAYTLAEFVYAFFSANPTIYDGSALFLTGSPHTNLGTANLSTGAMQTGVIAMREQQNFAGKRIGLRPRYLLVPPELEFVAMVVTKSAGVPGSVNNDINPMLGYVTPIVSPQLSSASQWFMVADPMVIDTIEIGFVGGQVNPALFIQDQPLFGLNFTQDVISYKIRHEYGGAVVDFRGLYRGI